MAQDISAILPRLQAAVERYEMIQPNDRIAVGVSGGKDSLVLLAALARLQRFSRTPFSLTAITLDPCFDGEADFSAVEALCERLKVPYILKRTRLWQVIVEQEQSAHPCSLCAKMRRGALHRAAAEAGCNVVALGHHRDDAAETFLMNLTAGATLGCFSPKTYLDRSDLMLIRPLIFLPEREIATVAINEDLPTVPSACPANGNTAREQTKTLLATLSAEHGDVADKILTAMQKSHLSGW